jgi:hypothetical protein
MRLADFRDARVEHDRLGGSASAAQQWLCDSNHALRLTFTKLFSPFQFFTNLYATSWVHCG